MDPQTSPAAAQSSSARQAPAEQDVAHVVTGIVAELLGVRVSDVHPESMLLDLGAESFDFVELVFRLERRYGVEIGNAYLIPESHTVDAYVRAVENELAARSDGMPPSTGE